MELLADLWNVEDSPVTPSTMVDLSLWHLQEELVPPDYETDDSRAYGPDSRLAFASMQVLGEFDIHDEDSILEQIVGSWPGISKWISFIYHTRVLPNAPDVDVLEKSFTVYHLTRFWFRLICCHTLATLVLEVPIAAEMSARLWEESDEASSWVGMKSFGMAMFARFLLQARSHLDSEHHSAMLRSAGSPQHLTGLVECYLMPAIPRENSKRPSAWSDVHDAIDILVELMELEPLFRHLLHYRLITDVVSILLELSTVFDQLANSQAIIQIVHKSFLFLGKSFKERDASIWTSQAVRAGFLQAFCKCWQQLSTRLTPAEHDTTETLIHNLTSLLIHRPVIEEVTRVLRRIQRDPAGNWSYMVSGSNPTGEQWKALGTLAEQRNENLVEFREREMQQRESMTCGNREVRVFSLATMSSF